MHTGRTEVAAAAISIGKRIAAVLRMSGDGLPRLLDSPCLAGSSIGPAATPEDRGRASRPESAVLVHTVITARYGRDPRRANELISPGPGNTLMKS